MTERRDPFIVLWTLAVAAATAAFVVYLAMRMKAIEVGYELGRAHARVGRLREVKRVLELELASHENPERVNVIAGTLFGMAPPEADRLYSAGPRPTVEPELGQSAPGAAPAQQGVLLAPQAAPAQPSATGGPP